MEQFFNLLKVVVVCTTVFAALFIVLLAMPKSQLRSVVLEVMGWSGAGAAALATVSPIDLIPDFIPVLGQVDDFGYIIVGLVCLVIAYAQRRARAQGY